VPFSIFSYLYSVVAGRCARAFDKQHRVLHQQTIEKIVQDPRRQLSLRIFESALFDHGPVEGETYYLNHPLQPLFSHDGHKRAFIAESCAALAAGLGAVDRKRAKKILRQFIWTGEAGYVQVLAWASLGRLLKDEGADPVLFSQELSRSIAHTTASLLGSLLYLEQFMGTPARPRAEVLIAESAPRVVYRMQRLILQLFYKRWDLPSQEIRERDIRDFFARWPSAQSSTSAPIMAGLKEIGLLSASQSSQLWENTSQKKVADSLIGIAGAYLSAIGAYTERR